MITTMNTHYNTFQCTEPYIIFYLDVIFHTFFIVFYLSILQTYSTALPRSTPTNFRMWTSGDQHADNWTMHDSQYDLFQQKWLPFKLCDDLCAMRPSSKQLLTSCRHQNSHILKQFYAHSTRIILFCLLSHFTFLFLLLYHNLTGPCSVCFHWPLQFFSPSSHHTIHLPLSLTIWSSQTDAKIQSDSFISDAVHRFWDSSQRFMTPEWHLALKQGRLALWMQ